MGTQVTMEVVIEKLKDEIAFANNFLLKNKLNNYQKEIKQKQIEKFEEAIKILLAHQEYLNWMERMIQGCDELGEMEREKAIFQNCYKKYREIFKNP